jgi:glucokinase
MTTRRAPVYVGGIDLGGTKILSLVASTKGETLARNRRPTRAQEGPQAVIARMAESLNAAARKAGLDVGRLAGVGVVSPGPIDFASGVVGDSPNLPGWDAVPLGDQMRAALGVPIFVDNDANAAALGECTFGAGRGYRHVIYITVSTGIGGGIIIDGRVYRGTSGAAGEVGHQVIEDGGPLCSCGRRGCLEELASGTAIAHRACELLAEGKGARIAEMANENEPPTAETVQRAAREGDPEARRIIEEAGHYLGVGLANLVNIFNPELIIIGGGLTNMGRMLLDPARQVVRREPFAQARADVRIVRAALGDRVGALGAAALAMEGLGIR